MFGVWWVRCGNGRQEERMWSQSRAGLVGVLWRRVSRAAFQRRIKGRVVKNRNGSERVLKTGKKSRAMNEDGGLRQVE
jgi:hypothetical protein